jgi:hypothetical protein
LNPQEIFFPEESIRVTGRTVPDVPVSPGHDHSGHSTASFAEYDGLVAGEIFPLVLLRMLV